MKEFKGTVYEWERNNLWDLIRPPGCPKPLTGSKKIRKYFPATREERNLEMAPIEQVETQSRVGKGGDPRTNVGIRG